MIEIRYLSSSSNVCVAEKINKKVYIYNFLIAWFVGVFGINSHWKYFKMLSFSLSIISQSDRQVKFATILKSLFVQ